MNAESKKLSDSLASELAIIEHKLHATSDDVDMLAEIQGGIGRLILESGNSDGEIRRILKERYDDGDLREETFQLVSTLLDRYVADRAHASVTAFDPDPSEESDATAPLQEHKPAPPRVVADASADDVFSTTTVIPADVANDNSADSLVQVGSLLRDRFLLQEKIAGGSMGVVYKAMDRRLAEAASNDYWVAIKVLSPQLAKNGHALRALQQEAAKGRCLIHPNIVRFIDLDRENDLYFLVMEWMEGRTLAQILDSRDASAIDGPTALRIIRDIGQALEYAHRCGIVHADIKPGNIMITPTGQARLFDFGVARVKQQQADSEFDPGVLGALTPAYSSMQVLTGEEPTAADDVFSLGCLSYRLLAGHRVFGPRNAAEASQEGMKPQRIKHLSDGQWRALKKALSYSRITRFETVQDFVDALDDRQDEPLRIERPDRFAASEDPKRSRAWLYVLLLISLAAGGFAYQVGHLDPLIQTVRNLQLPVISTAGDRSADDDGSMAAAAVPQAVTEADTDSDLALYSDSIDDAGLSDTPLVDVDGATEFPVVAASRPIPGPVVGPDPMLVDFSSLPPATEIVPFTPGGRAGQPVNIAVREDDADVVIDFVRGSGLSTPMTLRLEEVGFSGNRSPWASGQYTLSNSGQIHLPAGQARGRVTLAMASDPLREADQQSTLRLREAELVGSELALINLTLEDDDQRKFEAELPPNTIAFAASQASIREADPAVQIDLLRFNPDGFAMEARISVSDITATEGEDYFAPSSYTVSFGPGQRSARLLIPLVHDSIVEGDEAFVVELASDPGTDAIDTYRRIVVMIRDGEAQLR